MNQQRHIHDDNNYSFQDINISNIKNNNKKEIGAPKQYFSTHDSSLNDNNNNNTASRCVNNINIENENNDLIGNLEEFGLSQYEARAYLTMIGKGSLSASEIAYYSHLPRTKIYLTLKRLEKKGLSVISQQKPLICSAINPTEAFEEIVIIQEQKLRNMKRVVEKLQKINDESNSLKGLEEKRYFILDPKSTLQKLSMLVENSRTSITAILDVWGLRLLSECKSSVIKAITKGVKIQFLISNQCIGSDYLSFLPNEIMIKVGNIFSNIIILDSSNIINIDGGNGKAALFTSIDILGFSYLKIFEEEWKKAIAIKNLNKTDESLKQLKAVQIIKFIEDLSCFSTSQYLYSIYLSNLSLLEIDSNESNDLVSLSPTPSPLTYHNNSTENTNNMTSIKTDKNDDDEELTCEYTPNIYSSKNYVSFINSLEKYGINLNDFTIEELFQIVDLSLKMNYTGELRYDKNKNLLSIYSKDKSKSLVILTILLSSYLLNLKYKIDISPKISEISDDIKTDTFFIKFSKSLH
ncbi:MAG TPA: helix-turn-helix domain-containing protein [Nitrososphaeraceae archaeon]|nr:helix-turn-helix domain-containing protein [Nitrososphaeraceae archaeon]